MSSNVVERARAQRPGAVGTDDVPRGIAMAFVAVLLVAVLQAFVKSMTNAGYPVTEVTFFRNAFALLPAVAMVIADGGIASLRTDRLFGHMGRSVLGSMQTWLSFWSFHLMPLADAVAIAFSAPLIMAALAVPMLGERVRPSQWVAIGAGLLGVVIIIRPSGEVMTPGSLVALSGAVFYALAMLSIRQLSRTERPITIVFYFTLFSTVLSTVTLPFAWVTPSLRDLGLMALLGLVGGAAQYFLTRAYALAPAATVGTFNYFSLLWAALLGWMLWGDVPGVRLALGAAAVVAGGLYLLHRETRRAPSPAERIERHNEVAE